MSVDKGTQLIVEDILQEAKKKAMAITEGAASEVKMLLDAARITAREEEEYLMKKARADGERLYEGILASGRMQAKKMVLQKREELIKKVFDDVEKRLQAYVSSKDYEKNLLRIAVNACKKLGSDDIVVYANQRDLKLLRTLKDKIIQEIGGEQLTISFGEAIQTTGGVRVSTKDHKIEVDETFEGKMKTEHENLRIKIANILFEVSR